MAGGAAGYFKSYLGIKFSSLTTIFTISMIKVENLVRTYPGKIPTPALKGVSFEVDSGEFVAIMGRSGSGKSTLLHQLGLIDTPTDGKVFIDGANILELSDAQKPNIVFGIWVMFFRNMLSLPK